jgi:hypothetical protein
MVFDFRLAPHAEVPFRVTAAAEGEDVVAFNNVYNRRVLGRPRDQLGDTGLDSPALFVIHHLPSTHAITLRNQIALQFMRQNHRRVEFDYQAVKWDDDLKLAAYGALNSEGFCVLLNVFRVDGDAIIEVN